MKDLTVEDLIPLDEFAFNRREFFQTHARYVDRYRRVQVGPDMTLLFENRQTLWYRVQEIVRIARLFDPSQIQGELDLYNRLLPRRERLQAALIIRVADPTRFLEALVPWRELRGELLRLHIDDREIPANLLTTRPEDRCIGAAHWVQFVLDASARRGLVDPRQSAFISVSLPEYHHESAMLSEEVRHSLADDLTLSDKDPATVA